VGRIEVGLRSYQQDHSVFLCFILLPENFLGYGDASAFLVFVGIVGSSEAKTSCYSGRTAEFCLALLESLTVHAPKPLSPSRFIKLVLLFCISSVPPCYQLEKTLQVKWPLNGVSPWFSKASYFSCWALKK